MPGPLHKKSFEFAKEVIFLVRKLQSEKEFTISNQIAKSGTAIGALVREAEQAESKKDFIHKMAIGLKEANETKYWLDLLHETEILASNKYIDLNGKLKELIALLISIIKTSKSNLHKS